ncbi:MAG: cytidylate kinase-like family protein [Treponema sp.]|nr:cytidylate kinase-like family protein [Treponema sp.]
MAIITISRQLASIGDEIGVKIAEKLGYTFFGKKELEKRIVALGFPKSKLAKFEEKKLGFLAGLTHMRDDYLNFLLTAVLEAAAENNCVIVGRGSFIILKDLENHVSCRFIADQKLRAERIQKETGCNAKTALKKINESESQQKAFYKGFFNFDIHDPAMFDVQINTALLDIDSIVASVTALSNTYVSVAKEEIGQKKVEEMLIGQQIVNLLLFVFNLEINFLRASLKEKQITLHGMAASQKVVDSALTIVGAELPGYEIKSAISISQDFRAYSR